jgi:hypothetical protein
MDSPYLNIDSICAQARISRDTFYIDLKKGEVKKGQPVGLAGIATQRIQVEGIVLYRNTGITQNYIEIKRTSPHKSRGRKPDPKPRASKKPKSRS